MVRTRDTAGLKVGAKAPRKGLSGPSTSASSSGTAKKPREDVGGGNPVCPRETPVWQKPITDFFRQSEPKVDEDGSSKENVKPEDNRDVPSKSDSEGKESTEQTSEPQEKSDPDANPDDSGTIDVNSAGSSKE